MLEQSSQCIAVQIALLADMYSMKNSHLELADTDTQNIAVRKRY